MAMARNGVCKMANKIEILTTETSDYVASTSRYNNNNTKVLKYSDNGYLTLNTYKGWNKILSNEDRFTIVGPGHEYRPDLVSYEEYGLPDFWWKILEINGIKDIFDFKSGTNIRLPSIVF
jgi:hypothetical protein